MRELKEEMATLSRQEEEHKKRKMDAVSINCLAFQLLRAGDPNRNSPSSIIPWVSRPVTRVY